MNFIFEAAQKNLNFLSEVQKRNEAAAGVMLDYAAANRKQAFDTGLAMLELLGAQGEALAEVAKANEKAMEDALRKGSEAVVKSAEKIVQSKKAG